MEFRELIINAGHWAAKAYCFQETDSDVWNVEARIEASSKEDALEGANAVLEFLSQGRQAFIRVAPEADKYTNFDSKVTTYHGYVRFSFRSAKQAEAA